MEYIVGVVMFVLGGEKFIVGVVLFVLTLAILWLVRARDGKVIPALRGEWRQVTFAMCWVGMFCLSLILLIWGVPTSTWR